jgi:hypothetical protein
MIGQYIAVLIAIITLANTISVIAQSQNETNETDIGGSKRKRQYISIWGRS